jgi:Tol biopolymer transport system component
MKFENIENIALAFMAVFSIVLGGTAVVSIVLLAGLLSEFAVAPLHAQTTPAVELQAAMTKEQVDGDLKTAIAEYQKIAADKSAPRDVRAKALLHLAGCYEKLGQQAQGVYQQIVREFADQPAAAQARTRLAALKQDDHPAAPATMTQRQIEKAGRAFGAGDTDGHRVVYLNDKTGELISGDLAGNSKRVIFKAKPGGSPGWSPTRDFSMVLLHLNSKPGAPQVLAVVNIDGTGYREIAKLEGQPYCWPTWSWDNRYLLCTESQDDKSRLLRISVADGQTRELLSLKTGSERASFSPDGRFVAYQVQPTSEADPVSRIFTLPAEGGEPQLVYEERQNSKFLRWLKPCKLLDWTADGRYLAIASEHTGRGALDLLPIRDGKPAGAPIFVRNGDFEQGAATPAGSLVYYSVKPGGPWAVYVASLDANGRPGNWKRLNLRFGNKTLHLYPRWSADNNQIVYVGDNEDVGQSGEEVHLYNLTTGEDRDIYHAHSFASCIWAAQQPRLFCTEHRADKEDIFTIAADSGQVEHLATLPKSPLFVALPSRDDRALYLIRGGNGDVEEVLRWDIATGQETPLEKFPLDTVGFVSQDERWLMGMDKQGLKIRPASGGDWKPLVSLDFTIQLNTTPDGNWILYHGVDSAKKHGLFRIATAGGQAERLGDFPTNSLEGALEISPDGHKVMVAVDDYETGYELWSLENFVPPAPKP